MTMLIAPQLMGPLGLYGVNNAALFDGSTGFLTYTPVASGTRTKGAFRWFGQRSKLGVMQMLLEIDPVSGRSDTTCLVIKFDAGDKLHIQGWATAWRTSTRVFRDPTAMQDILVVFDTTQGLADDRIRVWVNGEEITAWDTLNNPGASVDTGLGSTAQHSIGYETRTSANAYGGYMADVVLQNNVTYTDQNAFGKVSAATGNWSAKSLKGIFGANAHDTYLDFSNAGALGTDASGNGNNWTVNGTVTQVTSTPTNVHCTWNPLVNGAAYPDRLLSKGNLKHTDNGGGVSVAVGTLYFPVSDQFEFQVEAFGAASTVRGVGIHMNDGGGPYWYRGDSGAFSYGGSGATWTGGDIIKVRVSNGELEFFKNGVSQGVSSLGLTGSFTPWTWCGDTAATGYGVALDCGQNGFTPSVGYKSLCTDNLPDVAGKNVGDHFNTVLYTGDGSSSRSISGVGFQPDFMWVKSRSTANGHVLVDRARGNSKYLQTHTPGAEVTSTAVHTSFDVDGFTVGANAAVNATATTYVAWCASLPNTKTSGWSGSPTISPSREIYDSDLGMSIVTYIGNGVAGATLPHSLGAKPGFIVIKCLDNATYNWVCYHHALGATHYLYLNSAVASALSAPIWNNTEPASTLITLGPGAQVNANGARFVAYIFAESEFIKIGSYTGNGSTDGPFLHEMVSPVWMLDKCSSAISAWCLHDRVRDIGNPATAQLHPNLASVEANAADWDFNAVGSKIRSLAPTINASSETYVYLMIGQPSGGRNTSPATAR